MQGPFSNPIEQVTKLLHAKRHEYQLHPYRDWAVLLSLFFLALIGVLAWNIYFFQNISSGDLFMQSSEKTRASDTVDRTRLDATLREFKESAERALLFKERAPLIDPSE